jgi:hypothetical protein
LTRVAGRRRRVVRNEINLVGANAVYRQPCEHRVVKAGEARLVDQGGPGVERGARGARDLAAELFLNRQRRQPGAAQRDQKRPLIVGVRARERLEVLIVHHDLDAVRAMLVELAANGERETREQTDDENGEQEAAVDSVVSWWNDHRAASSPRNRRNRSAAAASPENTMARREAGHGAVA